MIQFVCIVGIFNDLFSLQIVSKQQKPKLQIFIFSLTFNVIFY